MAAGELTETPAPRKRGRPPKPPPAPAATVAQHSALAQALAGSWRVAGMAAAAASGNAVWAEVLIKESDALGEAWAGCLEAWLPEVDPRWLATGAALAVTAHAVQSVLAQPPVPLHPESPESPASADHG